MAGMLITMEGVEGSGKSTQIARLSERMQDLGVPVAVSKEPGGTVLGRELRSLLLEPHPSGETWAPQAELLLFYADRAQHVARFIRPMLEAGRVVLLDRFEDSTRAYQGAQGVPEAALDRLAQVVLDGLRPSLTVVLDLDPEASLVRVAARNAADPQFRETRFDGEVLAFHRAVRARFLAIAEREPRRVAVVLAQAPPDQVAAAIWARVAPLLAAAGHRVA